MTWLPRTFAHPPRVQAGGELEAALATTVPRWLAAEWPLERVRYGVWAGE